MKNVSTHVIARTTEIAIRKGEGDTKSGWCT